jgi:AraC-like DNA-binding protein
VLNAAAWTFLPAAVLPWLPPAIAIPFTFVLGFGFAAHLAWLVHRLRHQRQRFQLEMATFAGHAAVALLILVLGAAAPWLGVGLFVGAYAGLIGVAFALALYLLLRFPDLGSKAAEAVATAYAVSTLTRVDRDAALARLGQLMEQDKVYTDESLNLAGLAGEVGLTPHQLSELVNTHFGVGFSRWVRQHRVAAAQAMLLAEPDASVLSVGLSVGFTSQSNFYAAFREITGEVPGRFRRQQRAAGSG